MSGPRDAHCIRCGATRSDGALRELRSGAHVCRNDRACAQRRAQHIRQREQRGRAAG